MLGAYSLTQVLIFLVIILFFLWVDLHSHKADKPVSAKNAIMWTSIWVTLAMVFALYIGYSFGADQAHLFLAGYLLEESLAIDNLFVIMAIFTSFSIKEHLQHRVLYYGILGALIMRLLFVAAGTSLVQMFGPYALAAFGLFVLWTAWKMWQHMRSEHEEIVDYSQHWSVRWTSKFVPVHSHLNGHDFFIKCEEKGKHLWKATPLFLCLVVVEISDVMFAFDSIPAIIAITQEPFLVYTSNIFAILGLRSLYFLLVAAKRYLCHLEKAVIAILAFIGIKMLLAVGGFAHMPPLVSLAIVGGLIILGILASFIMPVAPKEDAAATDTADTAATPVSADTVDTAPPTNATTPSDIDSTPKHS